MVRRHTALCWEEVYASGNIASGRGHASEMPVAMAVAGALCAALLGFGCLKAVRLVSQIR